MDQVNLYKNILKGVLQENGYIVYDDNSTYVRLDVHTRTLGNYAQELGSIYINGAELLIICEIEMSGEVVHIKRGISIANPNSIDDILSIFDDVLSLHRETRHDQYSI